MSNKILIIDDIQDNLTSITAILYDILPCARVFTATSGKQGITLAEQEEPDVILLDIVMPDLDGYEVCHIIKTNPKLRDIPVVFLTALKETSENRILALEAGAEAFLSKPVDTMELTLQIRAMLKIRAASLSQKNEQARLSEIVKQRTAELLQAQKMESVGRLAGGIAHDFNNMLAVILGQTELALDCVNTTETVYHRLREIETAAKHSADLTRQLLAFARKQTIQPRVLDINETIKSMLRMIERLIGADVTLAWNPQEEAVSVLMDPSQIDQILANLCINARDAITANGTITITTAKVHLDRVFCISHPGAVPGDYALLEVKDTGSGMPASTKARLFEPFFTTKEPGKGTGLGLSTVYGIVKQNNGYITVQSSPGNGSIFSVYIPLHEGVEEAIDTRDNHRTHEISGAKILLVEDEPVLLEMTKEMLTSLGYTVTETSTAEEALEMARKPACIFDMLITDILLPGMNGIHLSQAIRELHPDIKCLFTSGYSADELPNQGIFENDTCFIQKPFSRKELSKNIHSALLRKSETGIQLARSQ